ncbi:MAG: hypothetical protein ACOVVK_03965 [Elsteraceae bacterium]
MKRSAALRPCLRYDGGRQRWRPLIAAAAALALTSCSSLERQFAPTPAPKPATGAPKAPPHPPAPNVARPAPAPTTTPTPAPTRAAPAPPPVLVGLSEAEVEALLGPPVARATEGAGRSWRYGAGDCALTLFFFLDVSRNAFYALDQKVAGPDAPDACLRRVADAKPK